MNAPFFLYIFVFVSVAGIIFATCKFIGDFKKMKLLSARRRQVCNQIKLKQFDLGVPIKLDRHTWAEFEGNVQNLKQVIVVADVVQSPDNSLLTAVIHNFGRGVTYSFIVSGKNAEAELHGYLESFQGLAKHAIKKHNLSKEVTDLVSIKALPDDWNCVPLVFYRIADSTAATGFKTLAFWGDKSNAGIADSYEVLPPPVADALATALMSGAPQPVKEMMSNLEQDNFQETKPLVVQSIPELSAAYVQRN